ncbi:hypothetical protein [Membranihabitans marinus]|uniref:hypothetical protein n=1 Tax=Membranihabitans marinus TaxID=1227546 RepID=UPI001F44FCE9|nr:hypothetical protein [Membranihabitans marinus]
MKKKEGLWFLGTAIFGLVLNLIVFGREGFRSGATVDKMVHESHFVVATIHLIILLTTVVFFMVYLIRMFHLNFKSRFANVIFLISDMAMILILTFLGPFSDTIQRIFASTVLTASSPKLLENANNEWNNTLYILIGLQLVLLILLVVCGIKSNFKFRAKEK